MITLSLNFAGITGSARTAHEKQVRKLVDTHFGFPGSDKLKMNFTLEDNGSSSVSFAGPRDVISEAKRLWQKNVKPTTDKIKANVVRTVGKVKAATNRTAKNTVKKAKKTVAVAKKKVAPKKKTVRAKVKVKTVAKKKKR